MDHATEKMVMTTMEGAMTKKDVVVETISTNVIAVIAMEEETTLAIMPNQIGGVLRYGIHFFRVCLFSM